MRSLTILVLVAAAAVGAAVWLTVAATRRALEARLQAAQGDLQRVLDANEWRGRDVTDVRREVAAFRGALDELRTREHERRAREEEGWAILHRLASVLTGGQRAGRAGENVLRESLAHLPPSMVIADYRVNGRIVEFGLVLPDGRTLPIDSKWPAGRELEALAEEADPAARERLVKAVERTVTERAREVAGYLDPSLTAPLAVAAIPDPAYAVLRRAHADAYRQGVVVVPYSTALPVLLFLHAMVGRFAAAGDVEASLAELGSVLDAVESTLENKLARATVMLANGTEELRGQLGKARASLARGRSGGTPHAPAPVEPRPPGLETPGPARDLDGWEVIGLR